MRGKAGVADAVDADDVISDGGTHHEEVVDLAETGGGNRCLDDSSHLLEPAGGKEVSRRAAPITAYHPGAGEAAQGEGHRLQDVEVALGFGPTVL